jgi:hypothetical protein
MSQKGNKASIFPATIYISILIFIFWSFLGSLFSLRANYPIFSFGEILAFTAGIDEIEIHERNIVYIENKITRNQIELEKQKALLLILSKNK